ncbi:MAG: BrxA/BrxB family bacilliredoxin [Chitinophagales bacterium]|nr:BrxA/BrxB family bacilliredoxin [Bacteroidota bacterium]
MYPEHLTKPCEQELTNNGFKALKSAAVVTDELNKKGTTLLVINSVCGCAAANARPGALASVQHNKHPENLVTVFAGVDSEAVAKAREFTFPYPPSSPSIGLFKDGKLVHFLERSNIEGNSAQAIAKNLIAAYEEFC